MINKWLSEDRINDMKKIPILYNHFKELFGDKYTYHLHAVHWWAPENDWSHPSYEIVNTIDICDKRGIELMSINPYSIGIYGEIRVTAKELNTIRKICQSLDINEFYWTVI